MDPEVSVIMATYNRAHLLGRAIISVLNQTYEDFELIIVDDGSVDNTDKIVKEFSDKRIIYCRQPHRGAAAAVNRGIQISKGKYIAFLDSDDEWLDEKLQVQVNVFQREPLKTGVVYSGGWLIRDGSRKYVPPPRIAKKRGDIREKLFFSFFFISLVTSIVKRECFEKVGSFDEALPSANDRDMWLRISKYFSFKYIPRALANIYVTPGSLSTTRHNLIEAHKRLLNKYSNECAKYGKKVLSDYLCYIGSLIFQEDGSGEARGFMLRAIWVFPLNPINYLVLIASFFGKSIYARVREVKNSLFERFFFY